MRGPDYTSVDIMSPLTIRDPQEASITALRLPAFQHALMSGWGGPPQVSTMYAATETTIEFTRGYRVPPGVTEVDVEVRGSGNGSAHFTTAADATGVKLWFANGWLWSASGFSTEAGVEKAQDVRGGKLIVLAAPVWEWTDIDLSVEVEATDEVGTYTLTVYPHHVPR